MRIKLLVLGGTCLGTLALTPVLAAAQSSSDFAKIDRMQRQMEQLQEQIKALKSEMTQAKKKATELEAVQGAYAADVARGTAKTPFVKAPSVMDHVKLTWGGFLAAETVYRTRNEVADIGSSFTGIPFPFSPLFNESEFHGSARQSRLSLLVEGALDPGQKLAGYYEMDFLGVGVTSNYNQSNSWAPRLRHGYFTYDNSDWGFHFLAGQSWSLLTQNTVGITPRKENIPLTIDANYLTGFEYTRNWQLRFVKDFGPTFSFGVSVENPAELVFTGANTGAIGSGQNINGSFVNFTNAGSSFLGQGGFANNFNTDTFPDVIEKAAFDPGWGHYEVFGVQRFFNDSVFACSIVVAGTCTATATNLGTASEKATFGWGVGGSVLLPIVPTFLDFTAEALYGKGVGRYSAGQLSDVFVGPDGSLNPITELSAMAGFVAHPWAGTDIYAYGGFERADANFFTGLSSSVTGTGNLFGFGVPTANNLGCTITTAASFTGGASNCAGINKELQTVTVGFWHNLYKGDYGRVAVGGQYEFIKRKTFDGVGGAPSTDDNIFLTSFRYYPF
ncbi:MAG TPA: hypothetical protein VNO18_25650 [Xanthobacteraceae bacterium]|jgi:outer membrane murein-binding lipoprotein Lpp|nr:hypothetical protein [Xanthobacteraceae bacterium]